jgi:hypothetical protein
MLIETPLIDHSSFDGAVLIVGLLVRLLTQKIDNLNLNIQNDTVSLHPFIWRKKGCKSHPSTTHHCVLLPLLPLVFRAPLVTSP